MITLVAMVLVAVLVALVVDRAARRAQQAAAARTEAALLASFARTVLTGPSPLPRLLEKVRETFGLTSVALLERDATGSGSTLGLRRAAGLRRARTRPTSTSRSSPDVHLVGARPGAARGRPPAAGGRRRAGAARPAPAADRRRGRRGRAAGPRPPSCAPRCSRRSGTTCAPR